MPWIPDVVTRTTITSVWGNAIRNRVVHVVANVGERDATVGKNDGGLCVTLDTQTLWMWQASAAAWVEVWAPKYRSYTPTWFGPTGIAFSNRVGRYAVRGGWCFVLASASIGSVQAGTASGVITGQLPTLPDAAGGSPIGRGQATFSGSVVDFTVRISGAQTFDCSLPDAYPMGVIRGVGHGYPAFHNGGDAYAVTLAYPVAGAIG